ncbi:MAG: hypothetical protein AAF502_20310 [Bacteroidota bacterium]
MWKYVFIFTIITLIGCKQSDVSEEESFGNSSEVVELPPTITITGDHVRVRNNPDVKGTEVKFKLMKGDQCNLLAQGPRMTLNGTADYWYNIDCSDKIGWVWGGLTSMKGSEAIANKPSNVVERPSPLTEDEAFKAKWSPDENAFTIDIDLTIKMVNSLTEFYKQCPRDLECNIYKKEVKNAFDLENTVTIASVRYKSSVISYVEDETWPFDCNITDKEITLGPGIYVGMSIKNLENFIGKKPIGRIFRIQGENDNFFLWLENGKVSRIEYEGYTG